MRLIQLVTLTCVGIVVAGAGGLLYDLADDDGLHHLGQVLGAGGGIVAVVGLVLLGVRVVREIDGDPR